MMQASNWTTPAALVCRPIRRLIRRAGFGDPDALFYSIKDGTALDKTLRASSFDGLPNGQVETISGTSPGCPAGSAPRARRATLSKPNAVPPTNCLREMDMFGIG